ncbi:CoA transferase [Microbacterium sp. 179-I 3D2 NHS]|uniref:CoA transferase n=1 Tax=Microbacterium sp. 179-I 3D2 NHS TaxID=3235178 RepID=UPI0039A046E9
MTDTADHTASSRDAGARLLARVWSEIGGDPDRLVGVAPPPVAPPLPSRLATGSLAWAGVAAATLAAGRDARRLDPDRIALAYRSDRVLTVDGSTPPVWSPLSGFWRTVDGWIRTHGNYPHHAAALCAGLALDPSADAEVVRSVLQDLHTDDAVAAISATGGLAVPVRREDRVVDAALRRTPVVAVERIDVDAEPRAIARSDDDLPLRGIRILDLTRVIAGPMATRTLALFGADVLRLDPPGLPEPEWQHLDTGHGKRSALLDARSDRMHDLLAEADAVVLGYRPAAIQRLGLAPDALARRHPGIVVAQLSAWGTDDPHRAGFDSLVQAESGIALAESSDGSTPAALPAQALDHTAGYLLAAAIASVLDHRRTRGGSWVVRTSLRRVAAELLGMPRRRMPAAETRVDATPHVAGFRVGGSDIVTARPAIPGFEFRPPRPWASDQPCW